GAKEIYIQAGVSHAMPPANITNLANEDRIKIVKWFRAAVPNKLLN
ncbi:cysteine desulfurase, partial [bacterium]|nr:cysteine desulfurase [bacterium]